MQRAHLQLLNQVLLEGRAVQGEGRDWIALCGSGVGIAATKEARCKVRERVGCDGRDCSRQALARGSRGGQQAWHAVLIESSRSAGS